MVTYGIVRTIELGRWPRILLNWWGAVATQPAADQGRRGAVEDTEAAPAEVRDGDHRALSAVRELGRRNADQAVSGRSIGAPCRGHHGGIGGDTSIAFDSVASEQEELRDDRGLAQPPNRGRALVCLSRWHRVQAQLGRRDAQHLAAGCERCERERLSGDSRHLRGGRRQNVRI